MNSQGKLTLGADATLVITECADLKGELVLSFDNISQVPADSTQEVDVLFFGAVCGGNKFDRVSVEVANGDSCTTVTATQMVTTSRLYVLFSQEKMCNPSSEVLGSKGLPVFAIVFIAIGTLAVVVVVVTLSAPPVRKKLCP